MLKKLLNKYERLTNERILAVIDQWEANVFPKVRVADVIPIEGSGIVKEHYKFALQSHFDFLVTDQNLNPLFAVEFDGSTHFKKVQIQRDAIKDYLCKFFELPILRINTSYLKQKYRGLDLLGWFIHSWFAFIMLDKAQSDGYLPTDEPFDPSMIMSLPGLQEKFPLHLSADAIVKIRNLSKIHQGQDPIPSCVVTEDNNGTLRALAWLRLNQESVVVSTTGIRNQFFPVLLAELIEDVAVIDLCGHLTDVYAGRVKPLPMGRLETLLKEFTLDREMLSMRGYGK